MAERVGFEPTCPLRDKTLSRRPRYDHFGTSPLGRPNYKFTVFTCRAETEPRAPRECYARRRLRWRRAPTAARPRPTSVSVAGSGTAATEGAVTEPLTINRLVAQLSHSHERPPSRRLTVPPAPVSGLANERRMYRPDGNDGGNATKSTNTLL